MLLGSNRLPAVRPPAMNEAYVWLVSQKLLVKSVPTSVNCNRSCAPVVGVLLIVVTPPVTFARSQFVPAVPSVLIVLFSQLKIEPLLSVRPLVNVSVPGLLPGAKVPPACTVTAPPSNRNRQGGAVGDGRGCRPQRTRAANTDDQRAGVDIRPRPCRCSCQSGSRCWC